MALSAIAISIDGGFLQILQARKKGKSIQLDQAVLETFGNATNGKEKSDIIAEVWRNHDIKTHDVTLMVPRSLWTVKMVTVPSSSKDTVKQVMDLNIEQYLPFSIAESLWDWEVLRQGPGEESVVLLMAMRKQDFDERMEILRQAHLNLVGVEVSSVGLLNTMNYLYPEMTQQRVAFVDLQHGWVDVLMVDRGEMTASRGIELPKGIEAIPTWVGEIRHTLIAYDQNHPLGKIEKVVVVGSQFMLDLLREKHFEEPIQRPYHPFDMNFEGVEVPAKANMATLAGPLLRQLGVAQEAFHLSKVYSRLVQPSGGLAAVPKWVWVGAGIAGILLAVTAGVHWQVAQKNEELEELTTQLKKLTKKPVQSMDAWDVFMHVMNSRTKGVWFENFDASDTRLQISVKAESPEAAYQFLDAIKKKDKKFENADIENLRPVKNKNPNGKDFQAFALKVNFKAPPTAKTKSKTETEGDTP